MTFDHLPEHERYFDIASAPKYPYWAIFLELKKCEVVCRECHDTRESARGEASKSVSEVFSILRALTGIPTRPKDGLNHKSRRRRRLMESYKAYRETVPVQWKEWAENYPPVSVLEEPREPRFISPDYIDAINIADRTAQAEQHPFQVLEYNLQFYVVPKL